MYIIRCNTHNLSSNPSHLGGKERKGGYKNMQNSYLPLNGELHSSICKYITNKLDISSSNIRVIITVMMVIIQL